MGRRAPERHRHKETSFGQLAKELHAASNANARRTVVREHARQLSSQVYGDGNVMTCRPSNAERRGEKPDLGSVGKVIYDNWATASKVAAELYRLEQGRQYPYLCPRTRDGHHHLTSRAPWNRYDAPGVKHALLPDPPTTFYQVEELVSRELTGRVLMPPADKETDDQIHRWFMGVVADRWAKIKNEKGTN